MDDLLDFIYEALSLGMLEFITCFFLNKLFMKKCRGLLNVALLILFVPFIYILGHVIHNELIIGLIQASFIFFYICCSFECRIIQAILFLVIEQFVFIASASLGSLCVLFIGSDAVLNDNLVNKLIPFQVFVVLYTMVFLAMHIFCTVWKKNEGDTPISQTLLLCGSGVVSIICLVVNAQLVKETGFKPEDVVLSSLLPVTLFTFYLLYFWFSDKYYRERSITERERITREYASKSTEYYERLKQQQQEMRKLSHDMKNHLLMISCMKQDGTEKEYVGKLLKEIDQRSGYEDTENGIADIIFSEKQKEAMKKGIQIVISVEKGILHKYEEIELCTILTNAIDNAMEAIEQLESEKTLVIKGVKTSLGVVLTFENRRKGKIRMVGDKIETTKSNQSNHGYGLGNIEKAVDRLQGSMDINTENQHFRLSIMLPD